MKDLKCCLLLGILLLISKPGFPQTAKPGIDFETYNPKSSLVVPGHIIERAKFPFIDVHNHQNNMHSDDLAPLLKQMDDLNMQVMVNLSGRGGDHLTAAVKNAASVTKNRLILFTNVNFSGVGEAGWAKRTLEALENDVRAGARGLKIFKTLGLTSKDITGKVIPVNDSRLDPVWRKCAELGIPVLIHTADPKQFWEKPGADNERWLELLTKPGRIRGEDNTFTWDELMEQQRNLISKHPKTTFIVAHFGWYGNDLDRLGQLLEDHPNMNVEFGAIIAELGRQPRRAKQFFEKYQDRILFGKDSWVPSEYTTYFRVLETEDEYFPYHKKYHAFWRMYGMGLSDTVLKKIYYKNALRIIPGIDSSLFPD